MTIETTITLTFAIILSAFCAILVQYGSKLSSSTLVETLVVSGLGVGTLLTPVPINRYFLIGVLGYAAYALVTSQSTSTRKMISLVQISLALLLTLATVFTDNSMVMVAGLFIGVTLVPLVPFHLPFTSLVSSSHGAMSAVWTTVFFSLGLAELMSIQNFLSEGASTAISWLALGSALYASFKCLGQNHIRSFLAYAAISQVSMLWGLTTVFLTFSSWLIPFGLTIALVMTGLLITYHCIQLRFGTHAIGKLPGLALVMPRLGILLMTLISIAVVLPIIPVWFGLASMPTLDNQNVCLVILCFILFIVWIFGSWYFSHLMHQTAFGKARPDIPYTDLTPGEIGALSLLIAAASYTGLLY